MDVIGGPVPGPTPVELMPTEVWAKLDRQYAGSGRLPGYVMHDGHPFETGPYPPQLYRRLLDLEADLRHTRDVVAQLRREASDEIWLVALQRDEARAELADVHRHVADLDTQLAAARRQCEWYRAMVRSLRKSATAWLKEIALEFSNG
jgi:hypothetical protein